MYIIISTFNIYTCIDDDDDIISFNTENNMYMVQFWIKFKKYFFIQCYLFSNLRVVMLVKFADELKPPRLFDGYKRNSCSVKGCSFICWGNDHRFAHVKLWGCRLKWKKIYIYISTTTTVSKIFITEGRFSSALYLISSLRIVGVPFVCWVRISANLIYSWILIFCCVHKYELYFLLWWCRFFV